MIKWYHFLNGRHGGVNTFLRVTVLIILGNVVILPLFMLLNRLSP